MADVNVVAGMVSSLVNLLVEREVLSPADVDRLVAEATAKAARHVKEQYDGAKVANLLRAVGGVN